jgi:hypothetical protein
VPNARSRPCEEAAIRSIRVVRDCAASAKPWVLLGIASGINNAVASVANLFAVAILGAVALGILNHALDRHLQNATLSTGVQQAIHAAHGSFVIEPALSNVQGADRLAGEKIIKGSLAESIRSVMLITAVLAASAAAAGTLLPRSAGVADPNDS